ncbi:MAG: hypothetical protein HRU19_28405 [Pseudobacteriovorax sp.]|nr:hypothetical protein [Pseudobacteriovorax sp.]
MNTKNHRYFKNERLANFLLITVGMLLSVNLTAGPGERESARDEDRSERIYNESRSRSDIFRSVIDALNRRDYDPSDRGRNERPDSRRADREDRGPGGFQPEW